jgi:hypothetical protein
VRKWQCRVCEAALPDFASTDIVFPVSVLWFPTNSRNSLLSFRQHVNYKIAICSACQWFSSFMCAVKKPPKNDIILQFDNRHSFTNKYVIVSRQSTCIIFCTHNLWQLTFRCTIYVMVWFNASLTQSAYNRLCRGVYTTFSLFIQAISTINLLSLCSYGGFFDDQNIFSLRSFDLIKYQHTNIFLLFFPSSFYIRILISTRQNHYELILWHLHCGKTCVTNVINFV